MLYRFIISFLASLNFSISGESCLVSIFDCAQGNAIAAQYGNETMVFDAGRAVHSKFVQFETNQSHESGLNKVYEIVEDADSPLKRFIAAFPKALVAKTDQYNNQGYQEYFEKNFKRFVLGEDDSNRLKAVFLSHPDKDHYNLVEKFGLEPEAFILGGKFSRYKCGKFIKYVHGLEKKKTSKALYDHEYGEPNPYERFMARYTQEGFEKMCRFGKKGDTKRPQIEILSANTGNKDKDSAKNKDSLIIRLKHKQSILLTGDGEDLTFKEADKNSGGNLETDTLILSHHASEHEGCTSMEVLEKVKPKCCVISAGFGHFPGNQYHPSSKVIKLVLKYYKKKSSWRTEPHFVSYYEEGKLKSIITNAPLFTTIDNGTLTCNLSSKKLKLTVARDFWPEPSISLQGRDEARQPITIHFNTMERTLANAILSEADFSQLKDSKSPNKKAYANAYIQCKRLASNPEALYFKTGETYLQVDEKLIGLNEKPIQGNLTITHTLSLNPTKAMYRRG